MDMTIDQIERFKEIKDEMKGLLAEAEGLLRFAPQHVKERAKAYWVGHIAESLDSDNDYMGKSMCSMQDTIDSLDDTEEITCTSCNSIVLVRPSTEDCPACGEPLAEEIGEEEEDCATTFFGTSN